MAEKISLINMKGGVGKSTLAANLAWHFSAIKKWKKNVLLVDLDPQFNASQYTLGAGRYQKQVIETEKPTTWDIFEQATRAPGLKSKGTSLDDAIQRIASFRSGQHLDLVPSQLELFYTLRNPSQKEHLLANFIDDHEDKYDLILIDCAPTESVLTTASYLATDHILVPVKPDYLSSIGLPLIKQSMDEFQKLYKKQISMVGVCFNGCSGYSPEEITAKDEVREIAKRFNWNVFDEEIPYSRSFPKGAREGSPIFRTSYARTKVADRTAKFCNAFARKINL